MLIAHSCWLCLLNRMLSTFDFYHLLLFHLFEISKAKTKTKAHNRLTTIQLSNECIARANRYIPKFFSFSPSSSHNTNWFYIHMDNCITQLDSSHWFDVFVADIFSLTRSLYFVSLPTRQLLFNRFLSLFRMTSRTMSFLGGKHSTMRKGVALIIMHFQSNRINTKQFHNAVHVLSSIFLYIV